MCSCSCSMPNLEWVFTSTGDGRFSCSLPKPGRWGKNSETDIFRASGRRLGLERLELKSSEESRSEDGKKKERRKESGSKEEQEGPMLQTSPRGSQAGALTPALSLITSCRPRGRTHYGVKIKTCSCFLLLTSKPMGQSQTHSHILIFDSSTSQKSSFVHCISNVLTRLVKSLRICPGSNVPP